MSVPAGALEPLAKFESYGPQARKAALDHFGKSIEEIESILGKSSPDEDLRNDLAWTLWHYTRGKAGQDGSLPERQSDLRRYVESLDETTQPLRDLLAKWYYDDDATAATVAIMLDAAGVDMGQLVEQLEVILSVTKTVDVDKDKGGRPSDNEFKVLMVRVVDIFQQATGRRATLTWDAVERVFAGKFFRVAELVDAAAASATQTERQSHSGLGNLLRRLLKVQNLT